ncbi:DUF4136 domain-containing protein [Ferrimonas sp. SCSIO 43195]|uniref:DUF4136 domain-containing protein n=1 Tax=Ferrimonas sp. SCSIO 43195 TaxID=2822844 RepID=UPI002074D4DA|nr:DUF4136 domain-containing protein [Ferrimonas sp. SCSIO 43195]USD36230.1 DUF4136 domain-containing protein [Ferrimonas sp. SCSIO 43195]
MKLIPLCLALVLAGCSGNRTDVDYDPEFNFAAVQQVSLLPSQHNNDPLNARRADDALKRILTQQGWTVEPDSAIKLQLTLWQQTEANDSNFSIGIGGGRSSGSSSIGGSVSVPVSDPVADYQQFRIDMFHDQKQVWRSIDRYKINSRDSAEKRQQKTDETLQRMFASLPQVNAQ